MGFVFSYSSTRYWQTAICKHGGVKLTKLTIYS